jgi:hypothetical protein
MRRLLPERKTPRKLTMLDHSFVTAPSGVNQKVKAITRLLDPLKNTFNVTIYALIALDP